jgi:hypothetical protein
MAKQPDLGREAHWGRLCGFCGRPGPPIRLEVVPPDMSSQVFRFFCGAMCLANWETNQPKPAQPAGASS